MSHLGAGPRQLAIARIATFGIWIVVLFRSRVDSLHFLPSDIIDPRGIGRLLPTEAVLSSPGAALAVQILATVGCLACMLGVRPWALVAWPTAALLLFHHALIVSIGGYVNHAQLVPLYVALVLALFPCSDALSIHGGRAPAERDAVIYRAALVACSAVVAITYAFVGGQRLARGGSAMFTGDTLLLEVVRTSLQHGAYGFEIGLELIEARHLFTVLLAGMLVVTVFEALSPLALRFATFRTLWVLAIIGFHIGTLVLMNIFFWESLALVLVLFTPITQPRPAAPRTCAPELTSPS